MTLGTKSRGFFAAALLAAATPLAAETMLELPLGAIETAAIEEAPASHLLPTARFTAAHQPGLHLEGQLLIRAWRLPLERSDTLAVMRALRAQLGDLGFRILHECDTRACGGFDFRFNARILPTPAMEVDLADFRFLSAQSRATPGHYIDLLVSRSATGGHVQISEIRPMSVAPLDLAPPEIQTSAPAGDLDALMETGRAVLAGVSFEAGSTTLAPEAEDGLEALAEILRAAPEVAVVIVGHSDNSGSLSANMAVSAARARAVRTALVQRFGIAAARVSAEGAGFLAPIAPNDTPENQARNRRVEVILR